MVYADIQLVVVILVAMYLRVVLLAQPVKLVAVAHVVHLSQMVQQDSTAPHYTTAAMGVVAAQHLSATSAHSVLQAFRAKVSAVPGAILVVLVDFRGYPLPVRRALLSITAHIPTTILLFRASARAIVIEENKYGILYYSDFLAQPSTPG